MKKNRKFERTQGGFLNHFYGRILDLIQPMQRQLGIQVIVQVFPTLPKHFLSCSGFAPISH